MLSVAVPGKHPFPSPRQRKCKGLSRAVYPAYLRDQLDYDYIGKLSDAERQWLAAFTEEYLKGWCLKGETQVLGAKARRETWAAQWRLRAHRDPLAFEAGREIVARELAAEPAQDPEEEMVKAIDRRRRGRR